MSDYIEFSLSVPLDKCPDEDKYWGIFHGFRKDKSKNNGLEQEILYPIVQDADTGYIIDDLQPE